MPYTVPVSFDKFRENIELGSTYRETAKKRRDRLVSLLENGFEILEAFPTGSVPRFTAVKGHADLDVIVVLHFGKHIKDKKPSQVLQNVRDVLGDYKTGVRRNGQAVTLYYDSWPNVDIVPVSVTYNDDSSVNHYNVPDMNTESWIDSQPRKHSSTLTERNKSCGENFKRLIKMMKWWNHQHSGLMQSFHIEVLALETFHGKMDDLPRDIYYFFKNAVDLTQNSLWYELDYVDEYLDYSKRQEVVKRLEIARDWASDAWSYVRNDNAEKAIEKYRQIFGSKFPTYGS
jgi:hypothetical protein